MAITIEIYFLQERSNMNIIEHKIIKLNNKIFLEFPALEPYFKVLLSSSDNFTYDMNLKQKARNFEDICDYFSVERSASFSCHQTHSDNIKLVLDKKSFHSTIEVIPGTWHIKADYKKEEEVSETFYGREYEDCDGIITDNSNNLLVMKFADCTPIIIFDKKQKIIANIHSGWKGTAKKIFQKAIDIFVENNSKPENLVVFIAPSISKENFEVQQDLIGIFNSSYGDISSYLYQKDDKHYRFDMRALIVDELLKYKIPSYNIFSSNLCTYENNFLHSFRRDGEKSGRMALCVKMYE